MHATQNVRVATEFTGLMDDESKALVVYLVDMTEPGRFTQDGFICLSGVCDPEWLRPTGHFW